VRIWIKYISPVVGNAPPTPGNVILGDDDNGAIISGWLPGASLNVQRDDRLRAKEARFHDRGNRAHDHVFKTDREHGDVTSALRFLRDHPSDATREGELYVRIGNRVIKYPNAVVESCQAIDHVGVSTVHQYRIRTGNPV